jgi:hypothetical protein
MEHLDEWYDNANLTQRQLSNLNEEAGVVEGRRKGQTRRRTCSTRKQGT